MDKRTGNVGLKMTNSCHSCCFTQKFGLGWHWFGGSDLSKSFKKIIPVILRLLFYNICIKCEAQTWWYQMQALADCNPPLLLWKHGYQRFDFILLILIDSCFLLLSAARYHLTSVSPTTTATWAKVSILVKVSARVVSDYGSRKVWTRLNLFCSCFLQWQEVISTSLQKWCHFSNIFGPLRDYVATFMFLI